MHCVKKTNKHHCFLCPKKIKQSGDEMKHAKTATEGTKRRMIAIGEKVVMQAALVTMKGQNKTVTTRYLLDTRSTRIYVTEELKNSLKLKSVKEQTFSVYSFGNTKTQQRTLPVVN